MEGTKVAILEFKEELNEFLRKHDVLSVQHSHTIKDEGWGERHYHKGIWIVWYKD